MKLPKLFNRHPSRRSSEDKPKSTSREARLPMPPARDLTRLEKSGDIATHPLLQSDRIKSNVIQRSSKAEESNYQLFYHVVTGPQRGIIATYNVLDSEVAIAARRCVKGEKSKELDTGLKKIRDRQMALEINRRNELDYVRKEAFLFTAPFLSKDAIQDVIKFKNREIDYYKKHRHPHTYVKNIKNMLQEELEKRAPQPSSAASNSGFMDLDLSKYDGNGDEFNKIESKLERIGNKEIAHQERVKLCNEIRNAVFGNTNEENLKEAFKKLSIKNHPDKNKFPYSNQVFRIVKGAYDELSSS